MSHRLLAQGALTANSIADDSGLNLSGDSGAATRAQATGTGVAGRRHADDTAPHLADDSGAERVTGIAVDHNFAEVVGCGR